MTVKQFSYNEEQWDEIEKHLHPDTENAVRFLEFPWRDRILDMIKLWLAGDPTLDALRKGGWRDNHDL